MLLKSCEPDHPIVSTVNDMLDEVNGLQVQWFSNIDFYIDQFEDFKRNIDTNYHLFTEFVEKIN